MSACEAVVVWFQWGHVFMVFGFLLLGLACGLAANLERIGRIARWKAAVERGDE
jgi:hypothetical protein